MTCTASILITSFRRSHLLRWGLVSLAQQPLPQGCEIIILNDGVDDDTESVCREYRDRLNLKYVFTGQRNLGPEIKWRVPGYAINIGAQMSKGQILVISCAEMFHLNDCVLQLTIPLLKNPKLMGIPVGRDDRDGSFLQALTGSGGRFDINAFYNDYPGLNIALPFLTSVSREEFFAIGGYDEDFTGIGYDDDDLMSRLISNGCRYYQTGAQTIHLYHERIWYNGLYEAERSYNRTLYLERLGQVKRNTNKDWGML